MENKDLKTKKSQLRAVKAYEERAGKTTIACKVTKAYKAAIEDRAKEKGYNSVNAYVLALIDADMNNGKE